MNHRHHLGNLMFLSLLILLLTACPLLPETDDPLELSTALGYTNVASDELVLTPLPLANGIVIRGMTATGGVSSISGSDTLLVTFTIETLDAPLELYLTDRPIEKFSDLSGIDGCGLVIDDQINANSRPMYFAAPTSFLIRDGIRNTSSASGALHTRSQDGNLVTLTWELEYDGIWKGRLTNDINDTQLCTQSYPALPADLFDQGAYLAIRPTAGRPIELTIIDKEVHIMAKESTEYPPFVTDYVPTRFEAEQLPGGRTFFISSGEHASDLNDGLSEESPWRTLTQLMENVTLQGGDSVLLERGSVFHEQLYLTTSGDEGNVIRIASYGEGAKPEIAEPEAPTHTQSYTYAGVPVVEEGWKGMTLISCSDYLIEDITFKGGKTGIFLKNSYQNNAYDPSYRPHKNIEISSCDFIDLRNDTSTSPGYYYFTEDDGYTAYASRIVDPRYDSVYGSKEDRVFWYGGIFLGQYGADHPTNIHENLYIHDCTFTECDSGFGCAWYYTESLAPYVRNLVMEDCTGSGVLQGIFMLNHVDGALIKNVSLTSGGGFSSSGIAGAFLERCSDIIIDGCLFAEVKRSRGPYDTPCHDGVGLDFEGVCQNILLKDTIFRENDGSAILVCNTAPSHTFPSGSAVTTKPNTGIHLENCSFLDNAQNPDSVDFPDRDTAYEVMNWQPNSSGHIHGLIIDQSSTTRLFSPLMRQGWSLYGQLDDIDRL